MNLPWPITRNDGGKNEGPEEPIYKSGAVLGGPGLACGVHTLVGELRFTMILRGRLAKDRRSGKDRRQFLYMAHIPERRSGKDRRKKRN